MNDENNLNESEYSDSYSREQQQSNEVDDNDESSGQQRISENKIMQPEQSQAE